MHNHTQKYSEYEHEARCYKSLHKEFSLYGILKVTFKMKYYSSQISMNAPA